MIIQALVRYYDILTADETVKISKPGYSQANVSFVLVISKDGELTNIVDLRTDGKKKIPKVMTVPLQRSRSGKNPPPHFLCDKCEYIFGIESLKPDEAKKKTEESLHEIEILDQTKKSVIVVSSRSREYFKNFRSLHHSLLDHQTDPEVHAFLKFLDEWKPELSFQHPKIAEFKEDILTGALFVFDIGGKYLHQDLVVRQMWDYYQSSLSNEKSTEVSQCLVTGKREAIARTHQKVKGVYNPQGQISEMSLVSFNDPAFESYNKKQSFNAPISESAMFKYTTALKYLLEWDSKNHILIGDITTVFWAETTKKHCGNLARFLIDPEDHEEEPTENDTPSEVRKQDFQTRQLVSDILQKVRTGQHLEEKDLGVDPDTTKFYILGLSPNNARLAVRFWHEDNFGNFIARVARHHLDMEIEHDDRDPHFTSMKLLLKQTVFEGSKESTASPVLGELLMRAILEGTPYPVPMYSAIMSRVKVERRINPARAGFIKASLIRMARARGKHEEDMITVSLNEESKDTPYRLGRLFAVLEKAQSDTKRDVKGTITSKYFSSASTTPRVVFPVLLKLAQHHLTKSEWGFKSNQAIEEIMSEIEGFPVTLTLEEQGRFMLGYYHQRRANYRKKSNNNENIEEENKEETTS